MNTCYLEDCNSLVIARKMCSKHYTRFMQHGDPHYTIRQSRDGACMVEDCSARIYATQLCSRHYHENRRAVRAGEACDAEGCAQGVAVAGLCRKHYAKRHAKEYDFTCVICGLSEKRKFNASGRKVSTCGPECKAKLTAKTKQYGGGSRLSRAVKGKNLSEFIEIIKSRVNTSAEGCWVWAGFWQKNGYGNTKCNGQTWSVHRLVAYMTHAEYSDSLPVHHTCSNRACCNPEHLRIVTPQENSAEMMERNYYLRRIEGLESALRQLDPGHHLLAR